MNARPASSVTAAACATPVVFIVFNRPDCTAQSLARIRAVRPRRLYVIADGPRAARPDDEERCRATREVVDRGIDWPCEVVRDYAPANLGCARRVTSGLDGVFAREERAIVLEDDCVADATFFRYGEELLERYRDEPRVGQIAGCSFQASAPAGAPSYYFSRYPHCWGWATWRRAWRHYDHTMRVWREGRGGEWLARQVENPRERQLWENCFDATAEDRVDSWAYRWTATVWQHDWLTALPYRNLVTNVGVGHDATHTGAASPAMNRPSTPMQFPLVHPTTLGRDVAADEQTRRMLFAGSSWTARARRGLQKLFHR